MQPAGAEKPAYLITSLLSAAFGGVVMLVVTNAMPRMMKRMMSSMMESMRAQMHAEGCQPQEV